VLPLRLKKKDNLNPLEEPATGKEAREGREEFRRVDRCMVSGEKQPSFIAGVGGRNTASGGGM